MQLKLPLQYISAQELEISAADKGRNDKYTASCLGEGTASQNRRWKINFR